jgi:hypothetical protein
VIVPRAAISGDICVLLAGSRPPSERTANFVRDLREAFGGEPVEPLHITADRVDGVRSAELIAAIHGSLPRLRPAPVRVDRLFFLPSQSRGPQILKLDVVPDLALEHDVGELRAALRRCGFASLHGDDRTMNVSTLQRVTHPVADPAPGWDLPLDLFVADLVLVSRITGAASYEILDAATVVGSG